MFNYVIVHISVNKQDSLSELTIISNYRAPACNLLFDIVVKL